MVKFNEIKSKIEQEKIIQSNSESIDTINEQQVKQIDLKNICLFDSSPFYIHQVSIKLLFTCKKATYFFNLSIGSRNWKSR